MCNFWRRQIKSETTKGMCNFWRRQIKSEIQKVCVTSGGDK